MLEKTVCPKCGSKNVAKILYGYPAFNEKLKKQLDNGEIVLGGCVIFDEDPKYHCNDCKEDFGIIGPYEPNKE